jgi:hypothetical protein
VPIDVHGSLDRAKDVSSERGARCLRACHVECVRLAHADDVPLLRQPEDTLLSPARAPAEEETYADVTRTGRDPRSTGSPRRLSISCGSGCLPPLRRRHVRGLLLAVSPAPASRSRRPHVAPRLGTGALFGHCKRRCRGISPSSDFERAGHLCNPLDCRAWD